MSPPAWAYHVDNFHPPPDDELICSICQGVFCDPVQSPCNHVFCRNCIVKWLESNRNCPICRKRTTRATIQDVVPIIRNMIMKLTLYCHNASRGCEEKFQLESCEAHMKECPFEMVQCKNKPCKMMFMKRDLSDHELNNCPHSFVRCPSCKLKMPTKNPQSHNCIKELLKKLKGKNEKIKESNKKIKSLKAKLKRVQSNLFYGESASDDSLSPADILFELSDSATHSSSSVISSASDIMSNSDDSWTFDLTSPLRSHFQEVSQAFMNDSIEYPRASTSISFEDYAPDPLYDMVDSLAESSREAEDASEEPQARRPPKRRLLNRILDSTDEEDNVDPSSLPSRKRLWQRRAEGETNNLYAAGPSYLSSTTESSASANNSPRARNRNRFRLRPRLRLGSNEQPAPRAEASAAAAPAINPTFERTLSLLEEYNLESDSEWLPETESGSLNNSDSEFYLMNGPITSSDESSISGLDSDSSYEDAAEGRTEDLLNNFYGSSDSDEWLPH